VTVKLAYTALTLRKLGAAAAIATTLITPLIGSQALASPSADLWNLLNAAHTAAGCPGYGGAQALGVIAGQYARTMAFNNGHNKQSGGFNPSTKELLENQGYYAAGDVGEVYYFNPGGANANAAADFLKSNQDTAAVIRRCDLTQLEVGVWINGNNWAAAGIVAAPGNKPDPGPTPVVK
jgi:hypothetical protein